MSEPLERFHPRLTPEQAEVILSASDTFGLWTLCARARCRRTGGCRGFSRGEIPPCVPRLLAYFRVGLEAIGALVPGRPRKERPRSEVGQAIDRIQIRMARLLERTVEEMERQMEAKRARAARMEKAV